jgi:hypothetical protein
MTDLDDLAAVLWTYTGEGNVDIAQAILDSDWLADYRRRAYNEGHLDGRFYERGIRGSDPEAEPVLYVPGETPLKSGVTYRWPDPPPVDVPAEWAGKTFTVTSL